MAKLLVYTTDIAIVYLSVSILLIIELKPVQDFLLLFNTIAKFKIFSKNIAFLR